MPSPVFFQMAYFVLTEFGRCTLTRFQKSVTRVTSITARHRHADRHADRPAERQTNGQTDRQTDRQTARETHRQTSRQTGRETQRQTDRQTGRQTVNLGSLISSSLTLQTNTTNPGTDPPVGESRWLCNRFSTTPDTPDRRTNLAKG
eukprot:Selendium_serpulae@DN5220_c0_g2_i1.p2